MFTRRTLTLGVLVLCILGGVAWCAGWIGHALVEGLQDNAASESLQTPAPTPTPVVGVVIVEITTPTPTPLPVAAEPALRATSTPAAISPLSSPDMQNLGISYEVQEGTIYVTGVPEGCQVYMWQQGLNTHGHWYAGTEVAPGISFGAYNRFNVVCSGQWSPPQSF